MFRLNCLRSDFIKYAPSHKPNIYELRLNEIGGRLTAFGSSIHPVVILDTTKEDNGWFLQIGSKDNTECYSFNDISKEQIYDIRKIIESWLARRDIDFFYM